jgi:hypothetical protein
MKKSRIIAAVAFVLMLTIAATLITCLPAVVAQPQGPELPIKTEAYLYFRPNPIGVNQTLLVEAWTSPRPMYAGGGSYGLQCYF